MPRQIYFEEVREGEELPGYSLTLDPLRFHLQTSGSQDFHKQHLDEEFARRQGVPHIFVNTRFTEAALSRVVTDWMGDEGFLQRFDMQMRRMNFPGDMMTMKGKVVSKRVENGQGIVECELWAENQREGQTTTGKATVILPFRPTNTAKE